MGTRFFVVFKFKSKLNSYKEGMPTITTEAKTNEVSLSKLSSRKKDVLRRMREKKRQQEVRC